jgi:hypothetical protein
MATSDTPISRTRNIVIGVVVAILLVLLGYAFGRYGVPAKVVVQEKLRVETVEKQVVVVQTKTEVQIVKVTDKTSALKTDIHVEKRPDGTVVIDTHKSANIEQKASTETEVKKDHTASATTDIHNVLDQTKITETDSNAGSKWSLTIMPGFDIPGALGHETYSLIPSSIGVRHLVLGIAADRKLIGPLNTGVWANSSGAAGVSLRIQF